MEVDQLNLTVTWPSSAHDMRVEFCSFLKEACRSTS